MFWFLVLTCGVTGMMCRGHQWRCLTSLWIRIVECWNTLPGRPWPGFLVLALGSGRWTYYFIFFVIPGKVIMDGEYILDHVLTRMISGVITILRCTWTSRPLIIMPGWCTSASSILVLIGGLFTARQCTYRPVLPPVKFTCPASTSQFISCAGQLTLNLPGLSLSPELSWCWW